MKVPVRARCPRCGATEEFTLEIKEGQERVMEWMCPGCDLIWATTVKGTKQKKRSFNLPRPK